MRRSSRLQLVALGGALVMALSVPATRASAEDPPASEPQHEAPARRAEPASATPVAQQSSALAAAGRAFSVIGLVGGSVGLAVLSVGVLSEAPSCGTSADAACASTNGKDLVAAGAVTASIGGLALIAGLVMTHFGTRPVAAQVSAQPSAAPELASVPGGVGLAWRF